MSDTWSDVCETPTAVTWDSLLIALEDDGFVLFLNSPDFGQGFVETNGFMLFTGTVRSRRRLRERSGFLNFAD